MNIRAIKKAVFDFYESELNPTAESIALQSVSHQNKAKQINALITNKQQYLIKHFTPPNSIKEKQHLRLIIQYCTSVISLEYRHKVWPYEYMAFSRRVGELWERFCSAAWDQPSRIGVERIAAPSFSEVSLRLRKRLHDAFTDDRRNAAMSDLECLFELVGDINMKEDEVFEVDGVPCVIDFKSGFGSNEKGNTLRLQTVGRAYRLWNPNTRLLLLVRQEQNNNYLDVIKRSGMWDVKCGQAAYEAIDELTGSDITSLRKEIIDFKTDLSRKFWSDLSSHLSDLTSYLKW